MSPAHVIEPTYEAIKRRLMHGHWPPGTRLEAAKIADLLHVSITPVRDSLYRLTGERMVDFTHGEGFHAPRMTESDLRSMLELHLVLMLAALATQVRGSATPVTRPDEGLDGFGSLFLAISRRSGNAELASCIAGLGDRLHIARLADTEILGDTADELGALEAAYSKDATHPEVRALLLHYHERRAQEAAAYIRHITA
ncbi:GntR family transcriptional regulator [Blastomonas fulva]|uniref:GntR family transcriptional regulator n=1 Tax=Blastomonas fulva TaxID=1550728 RepID=UPI003F700735